MSGRSLEPSFGLLFGDLLKKLHVETTGAAIVLSTMDAVINFSGLLVGPLVKRLTYRKVAIGGCLLSSLGLMVTSTAASVTHIIITYSIITGLGIGLMIACTYVGLHIYFDKKKGQAVGLAMAGTALGYMAMPQIV
uniref:MFS domain-containing protein n=3 Tax=Rhodnius TaxID=13248 RepID=T1HKG3_RHOPR